MVPVKHISENADHPDETLLKAYQSSGDQSHLATLYMRYTDLVLGVCLKYLKDKEDAKDAVMNIYQELILKLKTHAVDHFKSWLYVVAKNHCLMQLRKSQRTRVVELQPDFMQSEDFSHLDTILERERTFRLLAKCIDALNEEQQQVIRSFYLDGRCYNEIVTQTGLEWNRVRSLVQNGRRNLKICMDKHE